MYPPSPLCWPPAQLTIGKLDGTERFPKTGVMKRPPKGRGKL